MLRLALNNGKSLASSSSKDEFTALCHLLFDRIGKSFEDAFHLERAYDYLMKERLRGLPDEARWREAMSETKTKPKADFERQALPAMTKNSPWPTALEGLFRLMERGKSSPFALTKLRLNQEEADYLYGVYRRRDWNDEWAKEILAKIPIDSALAAGIKVRWQQEGSKERR